MSRTEMDANLLLPNIVNVRFEDSNLKKYADTLVISDELTPSIISILRRRDIPPLQKLYDLKALVYENMLESVEIKPAGYFAKPLTENQKTLIAEYLALSIMLTGAPFSSEDDETMKFLLERKAKVYKLMKGGARKSRRRRNRRRRHTRRS